MGGVEVHLRRPPTIDVGPFVRYHLNMVLSISSSAWGRQGFPDETLLEVDQIEELVYGYVDGKAVCYPLDPESHLGLMAEMWPWSVIDQMVDCLDGVNHLDRRGVVRAKVKVQYEFMKKLRPPWSHIVTDDGRFFIHIEEGTYMVVRFEKHRTD